MSDDEKCQIKVTLGILGMTGVLVLIGSVTYLFNQISGNFHLN